MERLNRTSAPQAKQYTEKVIQFGEGNFLRAFIEWIIWKTNQKTDFNAGVLAEGEPMERVVARFIDYVLSVASGVPVNNEKNGWREIAIFKSGVTL